VKSAQISQILRNPPHTIVESNCQWNPVSTSREMYI